MVYNSSATEFKQFHAVNNDTYNHKSYLWKHWDGNFLSMDQVIHLGYSTLGSSPAWRKTFLKEPLGPS